jgi:hypothetical protein
MRNEQYNPRGRDSRIITERAADYYREREQPEPLQVCGDPLFWNTADPGGMPETADSPCISSGFGCFSPI